MPVIYPKYYPAWETEWGDNQGKRVCSCSLNLWGFSGSTHYPCISFPPLRKADLVHFPGKGPNSLD